MVGTSNLGLEMAIEEMQQMGTHKQHLSAPVIPIGG